MKSRNYKWADAEHTMLDCEIEHPHFGWIPYTTSENDTGIGKEIWDNRDNLDIAEYEGPTQEEQELQETEQEMSETASRISEIKEALLTAVLLDDTEAQQELKAEYKALMEEV